MTIGIPPPNDPWKEMAVELWEGVKSDKKQILITVILFILLFMVIFAVSIFFS